MSVPTEPNIAIISSDSPFVRQIVDASTFRKDVAQLEKRPLNSAETCQFDPAQIATIANAAFWASIAVEEGRPIRGILCVACPDEIPAFILSSSQVVSIDSVVELTTAAPNSALAIHTGTSGNPEIWGIIDGQPWPGFLRFRIASPGTVIASIDKNVIALIHDGRISIPQQASDLSWINIVATAFGTELPFPDRLRKAARLLGIVAPMYRHSHGGTLVVVSSTSASWRENVDIKYQFSGSQGSDLLKQRLRQLETAMRDEYKLEMDLYRGQSADVPLTLIPNKMQALQVYQGLVTNTLRQIGSLAAIDGAVVISEDFSLLGFSAKLKFSLGDDYIAQMDVLDGILQERVSLSSIGGTRHQSAARFVNSHHDALAFVASRDGHLTLFAWVVKEATVVGLRNLHHMIWEY